MAINEGAQMRLTALEFFAGIGLARAGLEDANVEVIWSNDYDQRKRDMYINQWGDKDFELSDIHTVQGKDLPTADIAWCSSPCTDLSLAGSRLGLKNGKESSAFFAFARVINEMGNRRPKALVLENVTGLASSHNGDDLRAAARTFNELGYAVDAITVDARRFVPQSRPRLFLIGVLNPKDCASVDTAIRPDWLAWLHADTEIDSFCTESIVVPDLLAGGLTEKIERIDPDDSRWWPGDRVRKMLSSMSEIQATRLRSLKELPGTRARTAYRRTRRGGPEWEMRADDIAGCLRTARGGSSKQAVALLGNGELQVRWMTGVEYARLMGAPWFAIDKFRESQVHYGFGDAVVVPVAQWIIEEFVVPQLL